MTAQLNLNVASTSGATNDLTVLGTGDWFVYPGNTSATRKNVAALLAVTLVAGTGGPIAFNGTPSTLTWSDGTPGASGSTNGGEYTGSGANEGFQITAPAGTAARTLRIYAGCYQSTMKVIAHLSDGSAADITNTAVSHSGGDGASMAEYAITYAAATDGQTLTVKLVNNTGGGNVNLQGAALTAPAGSGGGTAPPPATISVPYNDPGILFSPYTWDDRGAAMVANSCGSYLKMNFSGTSVTAKFDVSALVAASVGGGSYPILRVVIDGKNATEPQLSSGIPNVAITGLAAGSHTIEIYLRAVDTNGPDKWNTPLSALYFKGFTLEDGATHSAPAPRGKNLLFFGDSITEGYWVDSASSPGGNSSLKTVPPQLAQALGCEYGQVGYGAQGYAQGGAGNVPAFPVAIPFYAAGRSRLVNGLFSPQPDYICVEHGANGSTSSANVAQVIDTLRAAAPNAKIFIMVPAGAWGRAGITAGVTARSADTKLFLIDLGSEYEVGINGAGGGSTQYAVDNLHRNLLSNAKVAAGFAVKIQAALDSAASSPGPTLNARTVTVTLKDAAGPVANLTGIKVSVHDEATPDKTSAPRYQSATQTTNASGVMTIQFQSTLAAGGTCCVGVQLADGRNFNFSAVVA